MRPLAVLLVLALAACSSSGKTLFTSNQGDGGCTDSTLMGGTKGFGEDCTHDYDCQTVCCACTDGGAGSWLTRICQDGVCTGVEACGATEEPGFCK